MCGIVGYVGQRPVQDLLLAGLEKLEYRGYDSAGISMLADGQVESVRAVGNLRALREAVAAAGGNGGGGGAPPPGAPRPRPPPRGAPRRGVAGPRPPPPPTRAAHP